MRRSSPIRAIMRGSSLQEGQPDRAWLGGAGQEGWGGEAGGQGCLSSSLFTLAL